MTVLQIIVYSVWSNQLIQIKCDIHNQGLGSTPVYFRPNHKNPSLIVSFQKISIQPLSPPPPCSTPVTFLWVGMIFFWTCTQGFSQKGVQVSCGRPLFEEIQGKFPLSLIILWENMPSGCQDFNVWLHIRLEKQTMPYFKQNCRSNQLAYILYPPCSF